MILECKQLTKKFGSITALNNLNLSLMPGQIIGLLGPNGSGKSTLIKLMNGLLVPDQGEILIQGIHPGIETKKMISYLPERNSLPLWMTIEELMNMYHDFFTDFDINKADKMIDQLNLDKKRKIKSLSKGNREKVQLIAVMSRNAKIYCLDEPIGGVDPASRDYIIRTILSNFNEDSTIVISTHLIQDIENYLDYAVFIQNGCVYQQGSTEELRNQYKKSIDKIFREEFKC